MCVPTCQCVCVCVCRCYRSALSADVQCESVCADTGYRLDCVHLPTMMGMYTHTHTHTHTDIKTTVFEADGPTHFSYVSGAMTGATVLKQSLLSAVGWRLVAIPFWTWDKLHADDGDGYAKQQYLRERIEEVMDKP